MLAALTRTRPRLRPVLAPSVFDPSQLPQLRLWTPSTGATGGGSTAYASASSQYHLVTDKYALRCGGVAGAATLGVGIVGQFSLTTTAADQGLAGKCGNTADAAGIEYALTYVASPGRFRFTVSNGTTPVAVDANTLGAPAAGTWYSIAAWYDPAGGGSLNITVNDGATDGITCPITPQGAAGEFRVGRVGAAYLNGRARNVAVLRRPPTGAERTALHAAGAGVTYADAPASLKATWSLGGWWNLAIQRAGDRSYDQVRRPNIARKTGASLNGLTPASASPPAGFTGYQTLTQAATSYLGGLTSTLASSGPGFSGEINRFGPAMSLRLRVRRADTDARYQGLWLNTANAVGFCLHNNKLAYFQGGSTYAEGGPTLAAGVWYDVGLTAGVDAHWLLVLDGVVVYEFYYGSPGQNLDTIGGRTSTNANTLNGDLCGAEYYQDALSASQWADLHAGLTIGPQPVFAYRMEETGGTFDDYGRGGTAAALGGITDLTKGGSPVPADPPTLLPVTDGAAVRRLADASGGGRHLTAPAAEPAEYAASSRRLPLLGMPRGIRCDQQGPRRLQGTGVMGTVTEFTFGLAGLLSHPVDAPGGLNTGGSGRICPIVGCSNNGAYGTAAGDAWAILGYQEGRSAPSGPETFWQWYAAVRPAGGPTLEVRATDLKAAQPHPFGHSLTCRFKGGQYLALALNGVEIGRTTASVPASLALTGDFVWGKVASYVASGHQLHDLVVCNQAIPDADVTRLHAYWAEQMQMTPVATGIAYDHGPWNTTNPDGFSQMAGFVKCNNGDILLSFCNGVTDPQQQTGKIVLQRSTTGGTSWDAGTYVVDLRPTYDGASGESLFKLHTAKGARLAGDIGLSYMRQQWNTGSSSYPPGSITAWVIWSSDHGATWTAPTQIPNPSGFSDLATFGKSLQRPSGDIWVTGYAQLTATPGTWHSVIMASSDGGATWSLMMDMVPETGGLNTEMEVLMFDALGFPNEGLALGRAGTSIQQTRTTDGGANWDRCMNPDGSGVNPSFANTTPNLVIDGAGRLISIVGQRNVFYAADGQVVRNGLRIQVSLDRGHSWGPIVMLFDNRGRTNNGALIDGDYLLTASVDETGKIRWYRFPAAILPDVNTP